MVDAWLLLADVERGQSRQLTGDMFLCVCMCMKDGDGCMGIDEQEREAKKQEISSEWPDAIYPNAVPF
jgi:hypothetical protein